MATAPTYCTHRQLKDVFPQVDSFDTKRSIYGWTLGISDYGGTSNLNIYYAYNTGLITQLYQDGSLMTNLTSNVTTEKTQVKVEITDSLTAIDIDSTTGFEAYDLIKINNEWIMQNGGAVDGDTLTVTGNRALFSTHQQGHAVDSSVYLAVDESTVDGINMNWFFMMQI